MGTTHLKITGKRSLSYCTAGGIELIKTGEVSFHVASN